MWMSYPALLSKSRQIIISAHDANSLTDLHLGPKASSKTSQIKGFVKLSVEDALKKPFKAQCFAACTFLPMRGPMAYELETKGSHGPALYTRSCTGRVCSRVYRNLLPQISLSASKHSAVMHFKDLNDPSALKSSKTEGTFISWPIHRSPLYNQDILDTPSVGWVHVKKHFKKCYLVHEQLPSPFILT